jgi:hypothetical protein
MATLGRRTADPGRLVDAVLALGIATLTSDPRAILRSLALPCDAAEKIGVDPHETFAGAIRLMSPEVAPIVQDFLNRPPEKRSLKTMWYEERETPFGVRYVRVSGVRPSGRDSV